MKSDLFQNHLQALYQQIQATRSLQELEQYVKIETPAVQTAVQQQYNKLLPNSINSESALETVEDHYRKCNTENKPIVAERYRKLLPGYLKSASIESVMKRYQYCPEHLKPIFEDHLRKYIQQHAANNAEKIVDLCRILPNELQTIAIEPFATALQSITHLPRLNQYAMSAPDILKPIADNRYMEVLVSITSIEEIEDYIRNTCPDWRRPSALGRYTEILDIYLQGDISLEDIDTRYRNCPHGISAENTIKRVYRELLIEKLRKISLEEIRDLFFKVPTNLNQPLKDHFAKLLLEIQELEILDKYLPQCPQLLLNIFQERYITVHEQQIQQEQSRPALEKWCQSDRPFHCEHAARKRYLELLKKDLENITSQEELDHIVSTLPWWAGTRAQAIIEELANK